MEKEFNLSEKIEKIFADEIDCWFHRKVKKANKEFIKKLEEHYNKEEDVFTFTKKEFDKLAGDKLK